MHFVGTDSVVFVFLGSVDFHSFADTAVVVDTVAEVVAV
jgi:hypothetical protein